MACVKPAAAWTFGMSSAQLTRLYGPPDEALTNYTGEVEMLYADCFARFYAERLVECTFPTQHHFHIDGVDVLAPFEWLAGSPDVVDRARFRISPRLGLAFDNRHPDHASLTVFEAGRWDALLYG